ATDAMAIGTNATATAQNATALGVNSDATGLSSIAIGGDAFSDYGVAIGGTVCVGVDDSTGVGRGAGGGVSSGTLGRNASASASGSATVVGADASAPIVVSAIALGRGATVVQNNQWVTGTSTYYYSNTVIYVGANGQAFSQSTLTELLTVSAAGSSTTF